MKHILAAICCITALAMAGCASVSNTKAGLNKQYPSLEEWLDHAALPYLARELGENPRFKGESFLLVDMNRDNVEAMIDGLTLQLRETIVDALLPRPGIGLVWRPSVKPWTHHTGMKTPECRPASEAVYYVGIDASLSDLDGRLHVKIRALNIEEKKWITGFGIAWQGGATSLQKKALKKKEPDPSLLGLRPLPFNDRQADLLAAYLSRNLSCLFTNMDLDEAVVHVKTENPDHIQYFENAFSLVANYLAQYREVTVTDDPDRANIMVKTRVHPVHQGLYQIWASSRYKKDKTYVPGRETQAYAALVNAETLARVQTSSPPAPVLDQASVSERLTVKRFESSVKESLSFSKEFDICFAGFKTGTEERFYPMLKQYPGAVRARQSFDRCPDPGCLCYGLAVDSTSHGDMEGLRLWMETELGLEGFKGYRLIPLSSDRLQVVFSSGFD